MVAAPTAAFEHFGQIFQPLLGERAPARNKFAAPCHARMMCHDPARMRETDADATANQPDVTRICCGKDFSHPHQITEWPRSYGFGCESIAKK
jgi:hypothetical protein